MAAVARLILQDFRSYEALDLPVEGQIVALIGENGAGKTNILEALSLFTPGRGLRRAELASMARHGGDGSFAASITLAEDAGRLGRRNGAPHGPSGICPCGDSLSQQRIHGAAQQASLYRLPAGVAILKARPADMRERAASLPAGTSTGGGRITGRSWPPGRAGKLAAQVESSPEAQRGAWIVLLECLQ